MVESPISGRAGVDTAQSETCLNGPVKERYSKVAPLPVSLTEEQFDTALKLSRDPRWFLDVAIISGPGETNPLTDPFGEARSVLPENYIYVLLTSTTDKLPQIFSKILMNNPEDIS